MLARAARRARATRRTRGARRCWPPPTATAADARSVVLREVDAAHAHAARLHRRAQPPRCAQIAAHPQGTLVLWSAALRLAVAPARARWRCETAGLAVSSRWARLKLTPAAQDYLSPLPPGSRRSDATARAASARRAATTSP
ncbi:MAG: hypothetical protein MZW92_58625 [Comamonadaceae bacterium]|nr:hypothetical protein [Comamonadaceae bacterium]